MVTYVTDTYCGFIGHLEFFANYDIIYKGRTSFSNSCGFGKAGQEMVIQIEFNEFFCGSVFLML